MDIPRPGKPGILYVVRPAPWSVISNSNEWDGDNRSVLEILQTSRQVHDEARDLPYACNYVSFERFQDLGEFVGHASGRQLTTIQHIRMELTSVDSDTHNWGMLRFFPNLSSLRLIDVDSRSHILVADPHHPVAVKVCALRGLKELEVVLPDEEEVEDDEESKKDEPHIRRGAAWRAMATQPKPIAE